MSDDRGNFSFLEQYDERVAHLAQQAEHYVHSDPDSCMFKLRLMVETRIRPTSRSPADEAVMPSP